MSKKIQITISPDGTIKAETIGIKGKKCSSMIQILEEMLDAQTVDSDYTSEFFEKEELLTDAPKSKVEVE